MEEVDRIRLEQFRQLRREIRGSEDYLVVGIDVGKERHHAFFGTAAGKTLWKRMVFENRREGFEKLLEQVEVLKVQGGLGKEVFGLEPTANYHKPLADYLVRRICQVVLVSGVAVKANRKSLDGRWDKHDARICGSSDGHESPNLYINEAGGTLRKNRVTCFPADDYEEENTPFGKNCQIPLWREPSLDLTAFVRSILIFTNDKKLDRHIDPPT